MAELAYKYKNTAILSTPLVLSEGEYSVRRISLDEARDWVRRNQPVNYCGHETVRALGYEPACTRETCSGYDEALAIKSKRRLEFGREYSCDEIKKIGFELLLLTRRPKDGGARPGTSADVPENDNCNHHPYNNINKQRST